MAHAVWNLLSPAQIWQLEEEEVLNAPAHIYKIWEKQFVSEPSKPNFYLNTELMQFTAGKTSKTLNYLAQIHYQSISDGLGNEHVITMLFASNSLLENKQWSSRTRHRFPEQKINVDILSSSIDSEYKNMRHLLSHLVTVGSRAIKDALPDIVVMCCHPTRIKETIGLLKTIVGVSFNCNIKFRFNFVFDECDKEEHLTQLCKFLKETKKDASDSLIDDIILVTATGCDKLLSEISKIYPHETFKNIDGKVKLPERAILNQDYMSFTDCIHTQHNGPEKPLDYIKSYKRLENEKLNGKIIFAPMENTVKSHNELAYYVKEKFGAHTLLINGTDKCFISPLGEKTKIDEFINDGEELHHGIVRWKKQIQMKSCLLLENIA